MSTLKARCPVLDMQGVVTPLADALLILTGQGTFIGWACPMCQDNHETPLPDHIGPRQIVTLFLDAGVHVAVPDDARTL